MFFDFKLATPVRDNEIKPSVKRKYIEAYLFKICKVYVFLQLLEIVKLFQIIVLTVRGI